VGSTLFNNITCLPYVYYSRCCAMVSLQKLDLSCIWFLIGITTALVSFIFLRNDTPGIFVLTYFICLILIILFIILNWNTIYHHERFEINSRRLFRLAAERIIETSDGFTERPYSAGSIQATKDEILGFSRYLHANLLSGPSISRIR